MKTGNVFLHLGDLGDLIAFLPTIRALGGGHLAIGYSRKPFHGRESMAGARYEAIRPLLEEQSYIKGVRWIGEDFSGVTHDASSFRLTPRGDDNLAQWQARHLQVTISEEPWLTATPNEKYRGATVIARSARYHEQAFPWPRLLAENPNSIFVGMPDEHAAFQHRYGVIEYVPTADLLEMAEIMAAAKRTISNQTAAWWIAAGLGCEVWQETWGGSRDSVIQRPNAHYFHLRESKPAKRRAILKS